MKKFVYILLIVSAIYFLFNLGSNFSYLINNTTDITELITDKETIESSGDRVSLTIVDVVGEYAEETSGFRISFIPFITEKRYYLVELDNGSYISISTASPGGKIMLEQKNCSEDNLFEIYGITRVPVSQINGYLNYFDKDYDPVSRSSYDHINVELGKSKIRIIIEEIISLLIFLLCLKSIINDFKSEYVKDTYAETHSANDLLEKLKDKDE